MVEFLYSQSSDKATGSAEQSMGYARFGRQVPDVIEMNSLNFGDEDEEMIEPPKFVKYEDFESFKKQFNLQEILDKLVIKREFFIP